MVKRKNKIMKLTDLLPRSNLVICFKCGSIETHTERFMKDADDPNTSDTYCFSCESNKNMKVFTTDGLNSEQIRNHFMHLKQERIKGLSEIEVELEITKAIMPVMKQDVKRGLSFLKMLNETRQEEKAVEKFKLALDLAK